jgi:hypothetical protein
MTDPQKDAKQEVATTNSTTTHHSYSQSPLSNIQPIQSIAVISIAGFGGALAGLSMSRRVVTQILPTMHNLQLLSNQLPWLWNISCASFAGIVEFSTLVSPTKFVIETLRDSYGGMMPLSLNLLKKNEREGEGEDMGSSKSNVLDTSDSIIDDDESTRSSGKSWQERLFQWEEQSIAILGDYALGGAIAGAIFKGSQLRPTTAIDTASTTS